jgi:hypothetical protein
MRRSTLACGLRWTHLDGAMSRQLGARTRAYINASGGRASSRWCAFRNWLPSTRPTLLGSLFLKRSSLAALTEEESAEWEAAVAQAEAEGTFFIAMPHHCAVGIKPV